MNRIKALFKVILGLVLVASGIALEGMWLTFCFGTIVVGVVLLIWFTPILFFPFVMVSLPGWRIFNDGLQDFNPVNVVKVSLAIAPLIRSQIEEIERVGNLRVPIDARVMAYVAALTVVVIKRSNISLRNVIDVTATFFPESKYKLSVENLNFCVDYRDNLKAFWEETGRMIPVAQRDLATGHGNYLLLLSKADENRHVLTATNPG